MAAKKGTTRKTSTTTTKKAEDTTQTEQAPKETTEATETQTAGETTEATTEQQSTEQQSQEEQTQKEPEPTPEPVPEPVAEEPKFEVPAELQGLATRLNDYVEAMAPNKPMNSDEIQTQQLKLRSVINTLLKTDDELFNDAMKHVIGVVRDNRKTVFSERLIFRGFPQLKLARSERQRLETLISLFLATADANQPGKVKDVVDMNVVFRYVTDNDQQQRLQSFYGM